MLSPDLIPVGVGAALLATFAAITVLVCAFCAVCVGIDLAKASHEREEAESAAFAEYVLKHYAKPKGRDDG